MFPLNLFFSGLLIFLVFIKDRLGFWRRKWGSSLAGLCILKIIVLQSLTKGWKRGKLTHSLPKLTIDIILIPIGRFLWIIAKRCWMNLLIIAWRFKVLPGIKSWLLISPNLQVFLEIPFLLWQLRGLMLGNCLERIRQFPGLKIFHRLDGGQDSYCVRFRHLLLLILLQLLILQSTHLWPINVIFVLSHNQTPFAERLILLHGRWCLVIIVVLIFAFKVLWNLNLRDMNLHFN